MYRAMYCCCDHLCLFQSFVCSVIAIPLAHVNVCFLLPCELGMKIDHVEQLMLSCLSSGTLPECRCSQNCSSFFRRWRMSAGVARCFRCTFVLKLSLFCRLPTFCRKSVRPAKCRLVTRPLLCPLAEIFMDAIPPSITAGKYPYLTKSGRRKLQAATSL